MHYVIYNLTPFPIRFPDSIGRVGPRNTRKYFFRGSTCHGLTTAKITQTSISTPVNLINTATTTSLLPCNSIQSRKRRKYTVSAGGLPGGTITTGETYMVKSRTSVNLPGDIKIITGGNTLDHFGQGKQQDLFSAIQIEKAKVKIVIVCQFF